MNEKLEGADLVGAILLRVFQSPWIIHIFGDLVPDITRLGLGHCLYHLVT